MDTLASQCNALSPGCAAFSTAGVLKYRLIQHTQKDWANWTSGADYCQGLYVRADVPYLEPQAGGGQGRVGRGVPRGGVPSV